MDKQKRDRDEGEEDRSLEPPVKSYRPTIEDQKHSDAFRKIEAIQALFSEKWAAAMAATQEVHYPTIKAPVFDPEDTDRCISDEYFTSVRRYMSDFSSPLHASFEVDAFRFDSTADTFEDLPEHVEKVVSMARFVDANFVAGDAREFTLRCCTSFVQEALVHIEPLVKISEGIDLTLDTLEDNLSRLKASVEPFGRVVILPLAHRPVPEDLRWDWGFAETTGGMFALHDNSEGLLFIIKSPHWENVDIRVTMSPSNSGNIFLQTIEGDMTIELRNNDANDPGPTIVPERTRFSCISVPLPFHVKWSRITAL